MAIRAKKHALRRVRGRRWAKAAALIMDREIIKQAKLAAVEDEKKMSDVVEEAVQEWLSRRASHRAV